MKTQSLSFAQGHIKIWDREEMELHIVSFFVFFYLQKIQTISSELSIGIQGKSHFLGPV